MKWYQKAAICFLCLKILASIYSTWPATGPLIAASMIVGVNLGGFLILRLITRQVLRIMAISQRD